MNFITKVVCQINSVSKNTSKHEITHILSLLDPRMKVFYHPLRKTINKRMIFEDSLALLDSLAPKLHHMEEIIKFGLSLNENDKLLVHCYAGVSRSTASAVAIECARNNAKTKEEIDEVFNYIESIRPVLLPNSLMIRFTDEILKLDGLLIDRLHQHHEKIKNENRNVPFKLLGLE